MIEALMKAMDIKSYIGAREEFHKNIAGMLGDRSLVVVSNREPYVHDRTGKIIKYSIPVLHLANG